MQPRLFTQLYRKDDLFNSLIDKLGGIPENDDLSFDLILGELISYMLRSDDETRKKIDSLPLVNTTVRTEIYTRLITAKDFIHSNYTDEINLDALCKLTAMSKFHFLRMFKSVYGITPYQYLTKVRMERAVGLLKDSRRHISEIADELGFEYANSFIKAFQKTYRMSPLQYRKA